MQEKLRPPLRPGQCPAWCEREHAPKEQPVVHSARVTFNDEIVIRWLQTERNGVVEEPMVWVDHPTDDGRRYLEWRPETASDIGDLLAVIRVQDIKDIAARLTDSFIQLGGTL